VGGHLGVGIKRLLVAVYRVVAGQDSILLEYTLTGAGVFVVNPAEILLHLIVGDGRAGKKRTEGVDIDGGGHEGIA
jgi:hypothetical protein